MTYIGIDIGTTRIKALHLGHENGRSIVALPTPIVNSVLGDFRDAEEVFGSVVACIGMLISALSAEDRAQVEGIGVTSLSEEVVILGHDGRPLGAMPTWYNSVTVSTAATDHRIDPSFSWSKLRWARDHLRSGSSSLFGGASSRDVKTVTTLNSYICARLTGTNHFPVDYSHASRTGFFDIRTALWRTDVFESTGWPASVLPPLVATGTVVNGLDAALSAEWGMPSSAAVVLAGHDHFCGAFAVGVRSEGDLFISAGTSEAHCLILSAYPEAHLPSHIGIGRYVDGEHFYLHRQLPSGHLYRQWKDILGLSDISTKEEEDGLLDVQIGSSGTVVQPGLDTDIRSSVFSVDSDATRFTLLRAVMEGLACAALLIDKELVSLAAHPVTAIVASGVPTRSPLWLELRSHLAAAPLSVSEENESPALGAALICQESVSQIAGTRPLLRPIKADTDLATDYLNLFARYEAMTHRVTPLDPNVTTHKDPS